MNRRLASTVFLVTFLGAGLLYAQTQDLNAFLERGRLLSKAQKTEQALPYFLYALELGEKSFGGEDPAIVPLLNDLADAYSTQKHYRDAEALFERSLVIQERTAKQYQAGIAHTLNKLGSIYEATGRPAQARVLYQRILTKSQPALGPDDPNVLSARERLAKLPEAPEAPEIPETPETKEPAPRAPPDGEAAVIAASPGYGVHLTSIRDKDGAAAEWGRLRRLYPALLTGPDFVVTQADLGTRGIFYRVHAGPLEQEPARLLCAAFTRLGVWCAVARAGTAAPPVKAKPLTTVASRDVTTRDGETPSPAPAPTPKASGLKDGFRVHLVSIRDAQGAEGEWARLQRLYVDLLEGLSLAVSRADLGQERGVWFRIQGGSLSKQAASNLCASLTARKVWCQVVPPPGKTTDGSQRQVAQRVRRREPQGARGTRRSRRPSARCASGVIWGRVAPESGARRFPDRARAERAIVAWIAAPQAWTQAVRRGGS